MQIRKLRLRKGKGIELHKVTKPEGVEAGLTFGSAGNLQARALALVPCWCPQGACCQGENADNMGTKAWRWDKHKRPVQRRAAHPPSGIRETSQSGEGLEEKTKGWEGVKRAFQAEGSLCAKVWEYRIVFMPAGKNK